MKKNYKKFAAALALLCASSVPISTQLSGVYSINSAQGTGGTNYQTFTAFAQAITSQGVSGAVTVNVVSGSGPYNEQVVIGKITGVSATKKVTINGNNNLLTFQSNNWNSPATLCFNGSDYVVL